MHENSDKKVELIGDALLGIDYKKQCFKRFVLTSISGLSYAIFGHIILLLLTVLLVAGTIESYYKYSKYQK